MVIPVYIQWCLLYLGFRNLLDHHTPPRALSFSIENLYILIIGLQIKAFKFTLYLKIRRIKLLVKINTDRLNVRLTIGAQTSVLGKSLMILFCLIGTAMIFIALIDWLLGLLVMALLWTLFFGWLTLWNFYGKELLVINTTSINFSYRYGFYQTKIQSRPIRKALNVSIVQAGIHKGQEHFNLIFETYNEQDLPEEIYRTLFYISKNDLEVLKKAIRQLYFEKIDPALFVKQPYMLN
eukprot:gene17903-21387_t